MNREQKRKREKKKEGRGKKQRAERSKRIGEWEKTERNREEGGKKDK